MAANAQQHCLTLHRRKPERGGVEYWIGDYPVCAFRVPGGWRLVAPTAWKGFKFLDGAVFRTRREVVQAFEAALSLSPFPTDMEPLIPMNLFKPAEQGYRLTLPDGRHYSISRHSPSGSWRTQTEYGWIEGPSLWWIRAELSFFFGRLCAEPEPERS